MVRIAPVAPLLVLATVVLSGQVVVQQPVTEPRDDPSRDADRPAVFVIGDSTVKNHGPGEGWGDALVSFFDETRIQVVNWAMGGRSSRSFIEEGRWGRALAQMKRGDFVLLQFGHNDLRELTTDRGTIPSVGTESQDVVNESTKQKSTVRTFGWYLRQYARDARARGVTLIFLSPVPRNYWSDNGRLNNVMAAHARLMAQVAAEEKMPFFDLNEAVARLYSAAGQEAVTRRFFTVGIRRTRTRPAPKRTRRRWWTAFVRCARPVSPRICSRRRCNR